MINVGGNRIGTAEIENALLADGSRWIQACAVVGVPDGVLGTVPSAFIVPRAVMTLAAADVTRLRSLVKAALGNNAVPRWVVSVAELPKTHSGKYIRRLLRALLAGTPVGDLSTLANPNCIDGLRESIHTATLGSHSQFAWEAEDSSQSQDGILSVHPLLQHMSSVGKSVLWRTLATSVGFLAMFADHLIRGQVVVPGAGYIEMVGAGQLASVTGATTTSLSDVLFVHPLLLVDIADLLIECELSGHGPFEVRSGELDGGRLLSAVLHCAGDYTSRGRASPSRRGVASVGRIATSERDTNELYSTFAKLGLQYGLEYRRIERCWGSIEPDNVNVARLLSRSSWHGANVHPADLDAAIQLCLLPPHAHTNELRLPFAVEVALLRNMASPPPSAQRPNRCWAVRQLNSIEPGATVCPSPPLRAPLCPPCPSPVPPPPCPSPSVLRSRCHLRVL